MIALFITTAWWAKKSARNIKIKFRPAQKDRIKKAEQHTNRKNRWWWWWCFSNGHFGSDVWSLRAQPRGKCGSWPGHMVVRRVNGCVCVWTFASKHRGVLAKWFIPRGGYQCQKVADVKVFFLNENMCVSDVCIFPQYCGSRLCKKNASRYSKMFP